MAKKYRVQELIQIEKNIKITLDGKNVRPTVSKKIKWWG